jgi:phage baseplate assembly protein W
MDENQSFLGRGWSFPPEFSKESRSVKMLEDEVDIKSSLEILLVNTAGRTGYASRLRLQPRRTAFQSAESDTKNVCD